MAEFLGEGRSPAFQAACMTWLPLLPVPEHVLQPREWDRVTRNQSTLQKLWIAPGGSWLIARVVRTNNFGTKFSAEITLSRTGDRPGLVGLSPREDIDHDLWLARWMPGASPFWVDHWVDNEASDISGTIPTVRPDRAMNGDFAPFMYNHVIGIGTDQTLTIVAVGVELHFDPTFRASPSEPAQPDQGIGTSTSA